MTLVVPEGTILLGENVPGRPQTLPAVGLGLVPLPAANPGAGPVTLTGSTGSTIDATNARLVGAFTIVVPGGIVARHRLTKHQIGRFGAGDAAVKDLASADDRQNGRIGRQTRNNSLLQLIGAHGAPSSQSQIR